MSGSGRRPAVLLMRLSPAQIYCANTLFGHGVIDRVFVEEGPSGEPTGWALMRKLLGYGPRGVARRIGRDVSHFGGDLLRSMDYYWTRLATRQLMNRQAFHNARILGSAGRCLEAGLPVVRGPSVNSEACLSLIREAGYRLAFVFGTGLLRQRILHESGATFVNLHWGLAPRYRGEGIISALTQEGVHGLGVTVHVIDQGIDSGPILYQERLVPDPEDNVYAIGLRLSVLGTKLFLRVADDARRGILHPVPQALDEGTLRLSGHLKTRYGLLRRAQRVLADFNRTIIPGSRGLKLKSASVRSLRTSLAWGVLVTGATALARRGHGERLRILMYHGVEPRPRGPTAFGDLFIGTQAFERQMRHLRRAFCVISLGEAIEMLESRRPFPDRAVAVTFDDGYRNVLMSALPILHQHRIPVTVFVPPAHVAQRGCYWFDALRVVVAECASRKTTVRLGDGLAIDGRLIRDPERSFLALARHISDLMPSSREAVTGRLAAMSRDDRMLERHPGFALATWAEWREAVASGLIAVGAHGMAHRDLTVLSQDACVNELREARLRIEQELSTSCRAIAYPHGRWDARVAEAAALAGYACGLTTDAGLNDPAGGPFTLRRTMVGDKGSYALFCARASGVWERLRMMGQG